LALCFIEGIDRAGADVVDPGVKHEKTFLLTLRHRRMSAEIAKLSENIGMNQASRWSA
jgi:hypothetical protein